MKMDAPAPFWENASRSAASELKERLSPKGELHGLISDATLKVFEDVVDLHLSAYPIDTHFDPIDCHRQFGSDFLNAKGKLVPGKGIVEFILFHLANMLLKKGTNKPLWGQVFHADIDAGGFGGLALSAHANLRNALDFLPGDPWETVKECYANFDRYRVKSEEENPNRLVWCATAEEVEAARLAGKRALLFGCEGAHTLGKSKHHDQGSFENDIRFDRLRELKESYHGVYLTIDHYCRTDISTAGIPINFHRGVQKRKAGLSEFGVRFVEAAFYHGLVVDVCHSSDPSVHDICDIAKKVGRPVIASHAGMRSYTMSFRYKDRTNSRRMLSDGSVRAIVETGGAIGVGINPAWFMPTKVLDGSIKKFVEHYSRMAEFISRMPSVGSIDRAFDHLIFGTDFDGGISAIPFEMRSGGDLLLFTLAMKDAGWSDDQVRRVYSGNFLRILAQAQVR